MALKCLCDNMAPKTIQSECFKFREELSEQLISELIVDGGAEKVKEVLVQWGYNTDTEKIAVPVLVIGNDGKVSGSKWQVVGTLEPKAVKAEQIWPDVDKDIFIEIKINDMSVFPFYNRCRNVSGWLDSDVLTWSAFKKENKKKVVLSADQYSAAGIQKFCIRIGVIPISAEQASLTLAFLPLSKEDLKKELPEVYSKTYCPQVQLTLGANNTRATNIKLGVAEPVGSKTGFKILPLMEDMRSSEEKAKGISSMEVRKSMFKFLRTVLGFNNRIPKKLTEAMAEIKKTQNPVDPEWIWPEAHELESLEPLEEQGWFFYKIIY